MKVKKYKHIVFFCDVKINSINMFSLRYCRQNIYITNRYFKKTYLKTTIFCHNTLHGVFMKTQFFWKELRLSRCRKRSRILCEFDKMKIWNERIRFRWRLLIFYQGCISKNFSTLWVNEKSWQKIVLPQSAKMAIINKIKKSKIFLIIIWK